MPPEGGGGRFAEDTSIGNRKAAKPPEAVLRGDLRDLPPARDNFPQFAMDQIQTAQEEIAPGTYPQDILADVSQGPLANPDRLADLGQIKRPVAVSFLQFAQPL